MNIYVKLFLINKISTNNNKLLKFENIKWCGYNIRKRINFHLFILLLT
jgi:hypothetical protein